MIFSCEFNRGNHLVIRLTCFGNFLESVHIYMLSMPIFDVNSTIIMIM